MVWALMLTVFFGSILPDADTMASRSRFWIVSTVTMVPVSPRLAKYAATPPPASNNTITTRTHFFRNTMPPWSVSSQQSTVQSFQNPPPSSANTAATIAATPT